MEEDEGRRLEVESKRRSRRVRDVHVQAGLGKIEIEGVDLLGAEVASQWKETEPKRLKVER